jgi:diaminohydroxyphosphoribosylaminopyrimidine deaminase/5-amino-6-(5-phosphoribosylamino)uracil reductase
MSAAARVESAPDSAQTCDNRFMAAALAFGRRNIGQTWPNPAVGALVVRDAHTDPIIAGRGATEIGGRPHAETQALDAAGAAAKDATMYVTLEPCAHHGSTAPCVDAILQARIERVVVALEDPNPTVGGKGIAALRAGGVRVELGVGREQATFAHVGHLRRIREGRPQVILKLAVSADGKSALEGRRPIMISGNASLAEAHMLRARNDAVLVAIGTVLSDDPLLNCRLPGMDDRTPVRVVLDGSLRTPMTSRLVKTAQQYPLWMIARTDAPVEPELKLAAAGADVMRVDAGADGRIDLRAALALLAARGITRLLVEGGPILSAALIKADLVDEAVVVRSPKTLGNKAVPAIEGMPLEALIQSPKLKLFERRTVGDDSLVHLVRS